MTIKETKAYINSKLPVVMRKRLRPLVHNKTYRRKDGCQVSIHLPAFITLDVDHKFEIEESLSTYKISSAKAVVTIWKDATVDAHIVIY